MWFNISQNKHATSRIQSRIHASHQVYFKQWRLRYLRQIFWCPFDKYICWGGRIQQHFFSRWETTTSFPPSAHFTRSSACLTSFATWRANPRIWVNFDACRWRSCIRLLVNEVVATSPYTRSPRSATLVPNNKSALDILGATEVFNGDGASYCRYATGGIGDHSGT